MATHYDAPARHDAHNEAQQDWKPGATELVASIVTVGVIAAIFLNYVGAHLTFFGDPVVIDAEEVRNYWIAVAVLATSVLASFAAAFWRRASKSFVWHSIMALTGLFVAAAFAVTQTGPPASPQPEPPPPGSACHSGGDSSECLGG
jgi:hypothetical protein